MDTKAVAKDIVIALATLPKHRRHIFPSLLGHDEVLHACDDAAAMVAIERVLASIPQGALTDEQRDAIEDTFTMARDGGWDSAKYVNFLESLECFSPRLPAPAPEPALPCPVCGNTDPTPRQNCIPDVAPSPKSVATVGCFRGCMDTPDRELCAANSGLNIVRCCCDCHTRASNSAAQTKQDAAVEEAVRDLLKPYRTHIIPIEQEIIEEVRRWDAELAAAGKEAGDGISL